MRSESIPLSNTRSTNTDLGFWHCTIWSWAQCCCFESMVRCCTIL